MVDCAIIVPESKKPRMSPRAIALRGTVTLTVTSEVSGQSVASTTAGLQEATLKLPTARPER